MKEHQMALSGVNDSYLKTLLCVHAPSAIEAMKRVKTDGKYEEVNLLAAKAIWGNYLLNLETQGKTFHVINISWFSTNVHHKFRSSNICSSFSAGSIYECTKYTLQYMRDKNLQLPKSFIVHV